MKSALLGVLIGGIVVAAGIGWTVSAQPAPTLSGDGIRKGLRELGQDVGRYQIVNGTPQYAANIMLLDTVTGNSWVMCSGPDVGDQWCKMPQTDNGTKAKK